MLGRLSLNPMRHIDPMGTVVVPALLLFVGVQPFGWAKSVPVATSVLRNPRRALVFVALAGPAANIVMALAWCGLLGVIVRSHGNATLMSWIASMAEAGVMVNVVLAVLNLLPIPPLDSGRVLAGLLPSRWGSRLEKVEPFGMVFVLGLVVMGWLNWLFLPAFRVAGRCMTVMLGAA
jgi:Zn-dependent protease